MDMRQLTRACVLALGLAATAAAHAGRTCDARPLDVQSVRRAMDLAQQVAKRLDASGAQVVVLARAGQDLGRYGVRWSHMGFAYREGPGQPWRVVHKLNHCGTANAAIYRQGLGDFFLDRMHRYEAGYVVLSDDAQAKLVPILQDNRRVMRWNSLAYNMLAYPWSQRYQQSNQWVLETLAGAMDPAVVSRAQAQGWLQLHAYHPTVLHIGAFERLGARATSANIAFDDHPDSKRFAGHIETVTVDSAFRWLEQGQLSGPVFVVW